jgi:hypothetical protein
MPELVEHLPPRGESDAPTAQRERRAVERTTADDIRPACRDAVVGGSRPTSTRDSMRGGALTLLQRTAAWRWVSTVAHARQARNDASETRRNATTWKRAETNLTSGAMYSGVPQIDLAPSAGSVTPS